MTVENERLFNWCVRFDGIAARSGRLCSMCSWWEFNATIFWYDICVFRFSFLGWNGWSLLFLGKWIEKSYSNARLEIDEPELNFTDLLVVVFHVSTQIYIQTEYSEQASESARTPYPCRNSASRRQPCPTNGIYLKNSDQIFVEENCFIMVHVRFISFTHISFSQKLTNYFNL